jgi:hypothetical protein
MVQPVAVRLRAICSLPMAPRAEMVKLVAPASCSAGTGGGWADRTSGTATPSAVNAARIE